MILLLNQQTIAQDDYDENYMKIKFDSDDDDIWTV